MRLTLPIAALMVVPMLAWPANLPDQQKNPFAGNTAAAAAGKTLYGQTCQGCHGANAQGGRGPDLAAGNFQHGGADSDLFRTIRTGIPGTQMPAFSTLPADNVWRIITYLRSLNAEGAAANEVVTGNPAAGEKVFWGKGHCAQCHEVNARGSDVGPDLSGAGKNSAAYLRKVILHPNASRLRGRHRFGPSAIRVKTKDGREIVGIKRSEDNFTLILTDLHGKLHLLDKKNLLEEHPLSKSPMPDNYGQTLSPAEIQNLIAYLKTLKARDLSKTIEASLPGGLSYARLRNADTEPRNWLTYWGDYQGHHYSSLSQITPANVGQLAAQWAVQMPSGPLLESTPLVVGGVMYVTYTTNSSQGVYALDARTGLLIWKYDRRQKAINPYQTNPFNRGVAVLGNRVFFGTLDAALVALDARTGRVLWETQVADTMKGYSITEAVLALKNKVIVGVAGGEFGIRGFIDAYNAKTGKRLWRFYTVPGPGHFGNKTWPGDTWKRGSGATWLTGSYDPDLNLLYWAVGNPGPDLNGAVRKGDNLFTCSVVALDPDTGKLKWHYQFTPGDTHDWDANEDLILADSTIDGVKRKLLLQADRNGMFYVLDRTNGKLIFAKPYVKQTWNRGFRPDGRPILAPGWESSAQCHIVSPTMIGGADWQNPSYDPVHSVLYLVALESATGFRSTPAKYEAGREYMGGAVFPAHRPGRSGVMAIDIKTGKARWIYPLSRMSMAAGVTATGGGLVFVGGGAGNLIALDPKTGKALWHFQTGGAIASSPISYAAGGKQFVAISAGNVLYAFALPGSNAAAGARFSD